MGAILDTAKTTYAAGPAGAPFEPSKAEIIALFSLLESILGTAINGLVIGNAAFFSTRAAMYAAAARPAGSIAIVYNDGTAAYNGAYVTNGGTGSGAWTLTSLILPATFAVELAATIAEIVAARGGEASLNARLVAILAVATAVTSEVTTARNGEASLAARLAQILGVAAAVTAEVTTARGASATLVARLVQVVIEGAAAATNAMWPFASPDPLDMNRLDPDTLGGLTDVDGRYLLRFDGDGRGQLRRPSDPDNAADGHGGPSWLDTDAAYVMTFSERGDLIEAGQMFGGVVGKDEDGRPFVIDEAGVMTLLSEDIAVGDVAMGGPYLIKVAFDEAGIGEYSVRLFGPGSTGGSIFAGATVILILVDGQSLSVGSNATEAFYQMRHRWRGNAMMLDRAEAGVIDDVRVGNHSLDNQVPTASEANILGLLPLTEKTSGTGYGGQTVCSSFADKIYTRMEPDVGRPQTCLFAAVGAGGASYAELGPGTDWWTNKRNVMAAANRLVRARGARLFAPVKLIMHGESDHLRYSPAEQAAHTGYYADLMDWWANDTAATKELLDQQADVLFLMLAENQRHANLEVASNVAMLDAMRNHPDRFIVAGPQYPLHAMGHGQPDAVHLKASGEVIAGEYFARAAYELINRRNRDWRPLHITNVEWDGASGMQVTLHNPLGTTLVKDTSLIALREGCGFNVAVDGTETAVTGVTIDSTTQITLALDGVPGSGGTYRGLYYACKGAPTIDDPDPLTNTPAGNIRNTSTEQSRIADVILHDWLCTDYRPF